MAKINGRNGLVKIGAASVANLISISIDESVNLIDSTDLDSVGMDYDVGDDTWTASMECHWNKADATGQGAMTLGATVAIDFQPEGAAVGAFKTSGTAIITGRSMAGITRNDMIKRTFTLQGKGVLTEGAV